MKINAIIGCGGIVEGTIKFVKSIEDVQKIKSGDIVVTNDNSPLYSIAFLRAEGILSSVGGQLCHLAIIAREMNKPCLMGITDLFKIVKDGERIKLDASKCEIEVIDGK